MIFLGLRIKIFLARENTHSSESVTAGWAIYWKTGRK